MNNDWNWKTFVKWIVVIILTVAAGFAGFYLDKGMAAPIVHRGTTVTFTTDTGYFLFINADSVTLEAASQGFFVLYKATGEAITPTPKQPPLGEYDTYYVFGPASVSGGKWNVSEGKPTIQITSTTPITVTEAPTGNNLANIAYICSILGFLIWLILLAILGLTHFYDL